MRVPQSLHRFARADSGTALVEFAIVTPILLVLICGILDFGRLLAVWGSLAMAAREGARTAAVMASPTSQVTVIQAQVVQRFQPFGGAALVRSSVTVQLNPSTGVLTVSTGQYRYQPLTPILTLIGSGPLTLQQTVTTRWERSI